MNDYAKISNNAGISDSIYSISKRYKVVLYVLTTSIITFALGCVIGLLVGHGQCTKSDKTNTTNYTKLSEELQKNVDTTFLRQQLHIFASEVHQMGSQKNLQLAQEMQSNWRAWGVPHTRIYNYTVLKTQPHPTERSRLVVWRRYSDSKRSPSLYRRLRTVEQLPGDGKSWPLYHSYSRAGVAPTARFVYGHYGRAEDWALLRSLNVSFCGPTVVVLVRLGYGFRTDKVRNLVAACPTEMGGSPAGVLTYPDPWDFAVDKDKPDSTPDNTEVYPHSWWLPGDAAVLGNMKMMPGLRAPGIPGIDGVLDTVPFEQMQTPVPVQPISYGDARVLCECMATTKIPTTWNRSLPGLSSGFLESDKQFYLELNVTNVVVSVTMSNVIGWIPGSEKPERYVLLANHRDAWGPGASDPGSGTVIVQQVVKLLGQAYVSGSLRPRRTLMFGSWDGEEEGLLGSAQFVAEFSTELATRLVAHVNLDCPVKGSWSFNGRTTALLGAAMTASAANVQLTPGVTLLDDWAAKMPAGPNSSLPILSKLGGGSDHINFAYVLGVPSAYPEYRYKQMLPSMPAYHTRLDNIDYMERLVDPGFTHHAVVSRFVLDIVLRLSGSPLLPFSPSQLASDLLAAFPMLRHRLQLLGPRANLSSKYIDVLQGYVSSFCSHLTQLEARLKRDYDRIVRNAAVLERANELLTQLPRQFITRDGLPLRPTLRNILNSPPRTNSYLGSYFTGVNDAIDLVEEGISSSDGQWQSLLYRQLSLLVNCLHRATGLIQGGLIGLELP